MSLSQAQYEEISRWRALYFGTPGGKDRLQDLLRGLGLFVPVAEMRETLRQDPAAIRDILSALEILAQLGIWHSDNFGRLIDALAGLPMPQSQERNDGE